MTLTEEIAVRPATIWNILDGFLVDLAYPQDDICRNPKIYKPVYAGLVALVCEGKEDVLELIGLGKPYYPFILLSYYMLFHRRKLGVAEAIYRKLEEAYESYPYSFDRDEECALKLLEKIIEDFTALHTHPQKEYEGRLHIRLKETAFKIENIKCPPEGWSNIFRAILVSHLDPEKGKQLLEEILKTITLQKRISIDEDIAEAYNLMPNDTAQAIQIFLEGITKNVDYTINRAFKELEDKINKKMAWENRLNKIEKWIVTRVDVKNIFKLIAQIIPFAISGIPYIQNTAYSFLISLSIVLFYLILLTLYTYYAISKWRLNRLNKSIESFIDRNILKDLYETIWPSHR